MRCGKAFLKKFPSLWVNVIPKTQHINISVTSFWFCSLCKWDFLLNSSLDWTWKKRILLAHKELNQDQEQWEHPQDGGKAKASLEHAELCCQCVCCSFGAACFLLFSRKYFSLLFSSSLFLVWMTKRKRKCSHVLWDVFLSNHHSSCWKWRSYGHSCAPHSLGPSDSILGQGNECECLIPTSPSLFS